MRLVYNWQKESWPDFTWDRDAVKPLLERARNNLGVLSGMLRVFGFELQSKAALDALSVELTNSWSIEGVELSDKMVRSSLAHKLMLDTAGLPEPSHYVDGIVQVMLDAVQHSMAPVTAERLHAWHSLLLPPKSAVVYGITIGDWRQGEAPMQVVSGAYGHERVHFEAPPTKSVAREMERLINWINQTDNLDYILKAAITHLWFLSIHPFDDGNGRMARTLTEKLLARGDNLQQRFYSMSREICENKKRYYEVLEQSQRTLDITQWLCWFLTTLDAAITRSQTFAMRIAKKAEFWHANRHVPMNERQVVMVNKLWDGFEGKLTARKWAKMMKCSPATALRDINDLMANGVLKIAAPRGRSTNYLLVTDEE